MDQTPSRTATNLLNPDEELSRRAERALENSGYAPLTQVHITARDGRVKLEGQVPSYYMKQMAQAEVLGVEGIDAVRNNLVVGR